MKKILLIQSLSMEGIDIERVYPIGLVTLASIIDRSKKYSLSLYDMNMSADAYGDLKKTVENIQPDLIGISLRNVDPLGNRTNSLIVPFAITLNLLKIYAPNTPIMVGGTAFSLFPERLMKEFKQINCGIVGEAENNILPLLENFNTPGNIPGVIYRSGDKVVFNPPVATFNMADYIVPNRELLPLQPYLTVNKYVESVGVETKRGCSYRCAYCSYPILSGSCMRIRNPKDVVDEIAELYHRYGVTRIHLTDSIVNFPVNHLDDICKELIKRKLPVKWSGFFRENLLTPDNARLYADSGCECFSLSPDGLTPDALKILKKNLTVNDILRTAEVLSDVGIVTVYHFLVNTPAVSEKNIEEAKKLIDRIYNIHERSKTIGTIVLNLIRIMPNTEIERIARERGLIDDTTDLLYPTYYNPKQTDTLRYELEVYHNTKNILMWQEA